ncbi:MAG: hypothetical protein AVDCRST_MAG17-984 [uncultured Solirubrobacterales bacterium]|uniref:Uncharacterized protein n=1 Tax=uncultured Solirubrobacterales bacterium TaxID=768556 RepID=A0A6J4SCB3_9ACTN|nr:MAG: hypothetical protein AVDCRST_MAG17-984 [uncultured Solirubrobacterales bacterium]
MGLLDEAIREHLDLKRQHGAAEDELARQEAEALGPVTEADIADREEDAVDEPEASDREREAGWPFDRVAENELADEPEEPSFEWGGRGSDEVEVPSFVPAEPMSDRDPDAEPELVDTPTAAFDVLAQPVSEEEVDELTAPEPGILEEDPLAEDLETGPPPAGPETEFMPPPDLEADELEPLEPQPAAPRTPPTDLDIERSEPVPLEPDDPVEPDAIPTEAAAAESEPLPSDLDVEMSDPQPLEPDDPVEAEAVAIEEPLVEAEADAVEEPPVMTEPPLSEPEPLEPYPLDPLETRPNAADAVSVPEPEPSADPGEAPPALDPSLDLPPEEEPLVAESSAFAPEPPVLEESEEPREQEGPPPVGPEPPAGLDPTAGEPLLDEGPPPIGPEPAARLDPTAEQGDPPPGPIGEGVDPGADPPTQAWTIEDDLDPAEVVPIEESPVFEPLPDAEEGSDDALDPPSEQRLDLDDPVDTDFDLPAREEAPPAREQPPAARGFFEETEEHETLWQEERPGADPDFEN